MRPVTISDEQIVDAARKVFLSKGYAARTSEIAREAGISEGSIFKRFASKDELFCAAMGLEDLPDEVGAILEQYAGHGDLRGNLVDICTRMIAMFGEVFPRVMMLWSSGLKLPKQLQLGPRSPPVRMAASLAEFLRREQRLGRMRECDPHAAARTVLGGLQHYVISRMMTGGRGLPPPNRYVRSLVEVLWEGFAPQPDTRRPPPD